MLSILRSPLINWIYSSIFLSPDFITSLFCFPWIKFILLCRFLWVEDEVIDLRDDFFADRVGGANKFLSRVAFMLASKSSIVLFSLYSMQNIFQLCF